MLKDTLYLALINSLLYPDMTLSQMKVLNMKCNVFRFGILKLKILNLIFQKNYAI